VPRSIEREDNPLARAIGAKIQAVLKQRGESVRTLAHHLGMKFTKVRDYTYGYRVPGPAEAKRIEAWMTRRISYAKEKKFQPAHKRPNLEGWRKLTIRVPPMVWRRLRAQASRLNYPISAFCVLAVERLLDDEPTLLTIKDACRRVLDARMAWALEEAPALKNILQVEMAVLELLTRQPYQYEPTIDNLPAAAQRIAQQYLTAEGAPATPVLHIDDEQPTDDSDIVEVEEKE
jgi:transcriptional regulator with XRE-family HTH domain